MKASEILSPVPKIRIRSLNDGEVKPAGDYVLYWMTAFRRTQWNFALEHALAWAKKLGKPLVVLEALQSGYPWASDRLHHFVIQGMADNLLRLEKKAGVTYYPYVEPKRNAGKGLLSALAANACVVIGDDYPAFFLPRMVTAAAKQVAVKFESVDANGLLPLRAVDKIFLRAFDLRRHLQKNLLPHLAESPAPDPLKGLRLAKTYELPSKLTRRWPLADPAKIIDNINYLAKLPIDHQVLPVDTRGGSTAAQETLKQFIAKKLASYGDKRNKVEANATSGLSPYLHFGHISAHQVFAEIMEAEQWNPGKVAKKSTGSAKDWWGISPTAEGFIDQLATWRELGFNMCWQSEDYDQFDSLPAWAIQTLDEHASDEREHVYTLLEFEAAETHDELWNAAQRQLVQTGTMHNYLRMLWGKKILHWSASPREALDIMIELNNKYALDGRDPNSYSGIFWCLGRYDRPWGPEREIFGKIRYMTSDSTRRKMSVTNYLEEFGPERKLF